MTDNLLVLLWRNPSISRNTFAAELHGHVFDELVAAGIDVAQLNIADAAVDAAAPLRQVALDPPPEALLRVATGRERQSATDDERVVALLSDSQVVTKSAVYLATTREPLTDSSGDRSLGVRGPGFSQVALLRRRPDLSRDDFRARWLEQHTTVALDTQSTFRYVQHVVEEVVSPDAPHLDGIVEECFPIEAMSDPHIFFDTGGVDEELSARIDAMVASVSAFLDLGTLDVIPTSQYRFDLA